MRCENCIGSCKHQLYKDNYETKEEDYGPFKIKTKEFVGTEHYCDKNPEGFKKWWEDNGQKKSDESYVMDCYEPTEIAQTLDNMINLTKNILEFLENEY